jgi:UPF0271 protein
MMRIDINCDMGESFGVYKLGQDEAMMPLITSANIACGFHAGDPRVIQRTIEHALRYDVGIGAHPGFPDLEGFGRRMMKLSSDEVYTLVLYQVSALAGMLRALGGELQHVKPHGALYHYANTEESISRAIAEAVYAVVPNAILFGLTGSLLLSEGRKASLRVAEEFFADRSYLADGRLTPREHPKAILTDEATAVKQVLGIILKQQVTSSDGTPISLTGHTLCLHGDHPTSPRFARALRAALEKEKIQIEAIGQWL